MKTRETVIPTRKRLTVRDYLRLPESNQHCELIDGFLIREPSASWSHQTISMNLALQLGSFVKARDLGQVVCAAMDVILGENVVQPDLLFIAKERLHIIQKGRIYGAPDLAVEILSPRTASWSRFWRRDFYAQYGVREYWIVDPFSRQVEALELTGNEYRVFSRIPGDGELTSSVLPGLHLSLTEIFGYEV